jgi:serine protease
LNYNSAYSGRARASGDQKEHWVVFAKKGADTKTLETMCQSSGACEKSGHPSEGGVPFFEVFTTETGLEKVLSQAPGQF